MILETDDLHSVRETWSEKHRRIIGVAILTAVAFGIVAILATANMVA